MTSDIVKVSPGDTVLLTIGSNICVDDFRGIHEKFAELLGSANIIVLPEGVLTDITVFKRAGMDSSNMFLNGDFYNPYSYG